MVEKAPRRRAREPLFVVKDCRYVDYKGRRMGPFFYRDWHMTLKEALSRAKSLLEETGSEGTWIEKKGKRAHAKDLPGFFPGE